MKGFVAAVERADVVVLGDGLRSANDRAHSKTSGSAQSLASPGLCVGGWLSRDAGAVPGLRVEIEMRSIAKHLLGSRSGA